MTNSAMQKIRKHQKPKTNKDLVKEHKSTIRKARKNRHNLWIIKGDLL